MKDTPFLDRIAAVARRGPRFFVPGHKGNAAALPFVAGVLPYDVTEVDGACDLGRPEGPLAQSQHNMAALYGSGAALYSAAGSTSCIQAMLALFVGMGGSVVMARGCHVAAVRALAFLGAQPHWLPLQGGRPSPQQVAAALGQSDAKAVYITSPDYYGRMADVAAIAAVCHAHGAALLVDNAHGAHLRFVARAQHGGMAAGSGRHNLHPITLGADACADSAHKSLPCLTGAAVLHLRQAALADEGRRTLNLFCSTSPSYPVILSLDYAAGLLADIDPDAFAAVARRLAALCQRWPGLCQRCDDGLKLCLAPAAVGMQAAGFCAALLKAGIACEYFDGGRLVLMASPWNSDADFLQLEHAIEHILQNRECEASEKEQIVPYALDEYTMEPLPQNACGVRQALFGKRERLPLEKAEGRVMAGLEVPCPPGVPPVLPGEVIDRRAAGWYAGGGILAVDVLK